MKCVYLIQSLEEGYYKIGVSKNPKKRIKQLQTGNSSKLKLISSYPSEYANKIEKSLHNILSHCKKEGEWFDMSLADEYSFAVKCKQIETNIDILKKSSNVFI